MKKFFVFCTMTLVIAMSFVLVPVYAEEVETATEAVAEVGIQTQISELINKWLPVVIYSGSGVLGSAVVLLVGFRKVKKLTDMITGNGKKSDEALAQAKKEYEDAKVDFKNQLKEAKTALVEAKQTVNELSEQLDIAVQTNEGLIEVIGVVFNEVPQFVANGGADRIKQVIEARYKVTKEKVEKIENIGEGNEVEIEVE